MYILEGNIGAGKSTLLSLIQQACQDIQVIQEPHDNWASQQFGQSLLGNFYQDPKRWSYTLETLAMVCRVRDHVRARQTQNPHYIMERSVYSGHYCFAQNDLASGFFTPLEWDIYSQWVDWLVHKACKTPHGFIYLRSNPEVCAERIKKRNRQGEDTIPLEYLDKIHYWHEKFLIQKEGLTQALQQTPVLVLDSNQDFVTHKESALALIEKIRIFMRLPCPRPITINSSGMSHYEDAIDHNFCKKQQ